jgi:hypothetical protein
LIIYNKLQFNVKGLFPGRGIPGRGDPLNSPPRLDKRGEWPRLEGENLGEIDFYKALRLSWRL